MSLPLPPTAQKALKPMLALLASSPPDYYSFQQKARTAASRMSKPPVSSRKPDFEGAIALLFECARELLKGGEQGGGYGGGIDLACFMVDIFENSGSECGDVERARVTQLIALTGPAGNWRKTLIDKANAWSSKIGPYPGGDPELHRYIGELYYREGSFALAEPHFLQSATRDAGRTFGKMMAEWYIVVGTQSSSNVDAGVFAAHGVIPYLLLGSILAASSFLSSFLSTLSSTPTSLPNFSFLATHTLPSKSDDTSKSQEIHLSTSSTLTFLQLALSTIQRSNSTLSKPAREAWVRLCGTYQSRGGVLASPEMRRALQELGALYFGLPVPKSATNPLGDMMASLFGGSPQAGGGVGRKLVPPAGVVGQVAGLD